MFAFYTHLSLLHYLFYMSIQSKSSPNLAVGTLRHRPGTFHCVFPVAALRAGPPQTWPAVLRPQEATSRLRVAALETGRLGGPVCEGVQGHQSRVTTVARLLPLSLCGPHVLCLLNLPDYPMCSRKTEPLCGCHVSTATLSRPRLWEPRAGAPKARAPAAFSPRASPYSPPPGPSLHPSAFPKASCASWSCS